MKEKKDIINSQGQLTPYEVSDLKWIAGELGVLTDSGEINESELTRLDNLISSLLNLRETYVRRLISLLKQGHMLD